MRERIARMLGAEPAGMWVGTFHAIGARILRRHADRLGWDRTFSHLRRRAVAAAGEEGPGAGGARPEALEPEGAAGARSATPRTSSSRPRRSRGTTRAPSTSSCATWPRCSARTRTRSQDQNAFDFDDLLQKPVELLEQNPALLEAYRERFAFVLVDEYQDTNRAQFRFLELLAADHGNLMVVGDDDQSIYGWRGADIRNILDFEKTFPGARVVRLERNYRSTQRILDAANAVIAENVNRKGKTLRTERDGRRAHHPGGDVRRGRRGPLDRGRHPGALPRRRRDSRTGPSPCSTAPTPRPARWRTPSAAEGVAVPGGGQRALLRAPGDPGRAGVPAPDLQPPGRGGLRPGGELPAPGDRAGLPGAARRVGGLARAHPPGGRRPRRRGRRHPAGRRAGAPARSPRSSRSTRCAPRRRGWASCWRSWWRSWTWRATSWTRGPRARTGRATWPS